MEGLKTYINRTVVNNKHLDPICFDTSLCIRIHYYYRENGCKFEFDDYTFSKEIGIVDLDSYLINTY